MFINNLISMITGRSCWRKRFDGAEDVVGEQADRKQVLNPLYNVWL
jgi:hypothetical protein